MLQSNTTQTLYLIYCLTCTIHASVYTENYQVYQYKGTPMRKITSEYTASKGATFLALSCRKIPYNNKLCEKRRLKILFF